MREGDGARPFLTDTCTLYKSTRHNAVDHLETAYRHGLLPYVVDAPVIMADGVTSKCYEEVAVNLKHFASVKTAQAFLSANAMVVLSHFKGHAMGGFGGAIKNLAMGCARRPGKSISTAKRRDLPEMHWAAGSACRCARETRFHWKKPRRAVMPSSTRNAASVVTNA